MRLRIAFAVALIAAAAVAQEDRDLEQMSLEQLMNVHVVSVSNVSERLSDAPATAIVISADDIKQRGYRDLSQIYDDLPGMDVVRPYGATYLKNYWRGYRNTIGDPFLVMIDGVVFNHLYFNTTDVLVTFPLSDVDRVEVVYGPASSVYGANAFMGVINVITRSANNVTLTTGSDSERLGDLTWSLTRGNAKMRLAAKFDEGQLDHHATESYEYTKNQYYADPQLWGGFVNDPHIGGRSSSPHHNVGVDFRLVDGGLEAALQYFRLDAGYGLEYAGDRAQNHATWARPDLSAYLRYAHDWTPTIHGSTLVRYRSSDVSNDSYFAESFPGPPSQTVDFSYWRSTNSSWTLSHDADINLTKSFTLRAGVRWEQKHLQKAYDVTYGPLLPPSAIDPSTYAFPPRPSGFSPERLQRTDSGVYLQSWYQLSPAHRLNFGVRDDRDSRYGTATTIRAGYVGHIGRWVLKAVYGQAFEEPNERLLYGGWDGSGSDPRLRPERSITAEASAQYTTPLFMQLLSVYRTRNRNTFVNTVHSALNLGTRDVTGFDYEAQAVLPHGARTWIYYSRYLHADERKLDEFGNDIGQGPIGDLADNKIHAGISGTSGALTGSLRGRYIDHRDTVDSNPVRRVGSFTTVDAFLRYDFAHLGVSVGADNLLNRTYFDPGVRDASAGTTPGSFDTNGVWHGSNGYFNSLLPQPGRTVFVSVHLGR